MLQNGWLNDSRNESAARRHPEADDAYKVAVSINNYLTGKLNTSLEHAPHKFHSFVNTSF